VRWATTPRFFGLTRLSRQAVLRKLARPFFSSSTIILIRYALGAIDLDTVPKGL